MARLLFNTASPRSKNQEAQVNMAYLAEVTALTDELVSLITSVSQVLDVFYLFPSLQSLTMPLKV